MTTFDFNKFFDVTFPADKFGKHFVGYDGVIKKFQEASETMAKVIPNYPPYNIVKVDDNKFVIEMAVAGFGKHNLDVTIQDGTLTIAGHTDVGDLEQEGLNNQYIYKGIADRPFTRTFSIADSVEIKNADLINGMLKIWLEAIIPDSKKPKKVDINEPSSPTVKTEKSFLAEGSK